MTTLYLIRHGETDWNRQGRWQGQTDVPLNDLGRRQATALAPRLAALPVDWVYSSDLSRAQQTAAIALPEHALRLEPRLREIDVGRLAGHAAGDWANLDPAWGDAFARDRLGTAYPDGESTLQMQQRVRAVLWDILAAHPEETVALVSHGGTIKLIICEALQLPLEKRSRFRLDNCGLTCIRWSEKRQEVQWLNDISHLSAVSVTELEGL